MVHSNVYILRIVDEVDGKPSMFWFLGPYGATRADQVADELEAIRPQRTVYVEPLFSREDCLCVTDYSARMRDNSLV